MGLRAALTLPRLLARGPLYCCCALACSVYQDPHAGASPPLDQGGSSGSSSSGAGSDSGGNAGTSSGASASSGGAGNGGSAAPTGGSAVGGGGAGGSASSAGTSSAAGAGGSSGSAADGGGGEGGDITAGEGAVVDDMEDNDAQISVLQGRDGFWYVGNDGTVGGTQTPAASAFAMAALTSGDRDGSEFAAYMKVSGYTGWGSVIGFNLVELLGAVMPYDAASYCGVSFWAKAAATTAVRVRIPDGDTHPAGGVCVDGGAAGTGCYDHFGKSATFGSTWSKVELRFSELAQTGSGYHPADKKLKPSQLYAIEWALTGANQAYEIWIDDVAFLACN